MNAFTISLQVHHVSRDLNFLTEMLAMQPAFCMTAGQDVGGSVRKTSVWHAPLFRGEHQQHFEQALEALLGFVKQHDATIAEFAGDESLLEVIFTFKVDAALAQSGDMAQTVNLQPYLLYELSSRQIGVKVQMLYS